MFTTIHLLPCLINDVAVAVVCHCPVPGLPFYMNLVYRAAVRASVDLIDCGLLVGLSVLRRWMVDVRFDVLVGLLFLCLHDFVV